ncbi:MAG: prepilin-type N-terminal cleavage/methylation domain-containing protein [Candidatus Abyssobacteria bacterium SURF_17]|uniref:Prepilin-type N-terminal cleavage/methylation domain-containing protein n=1 Tax=Candidatus Abyssobacteria bacterium SURF_17 TaxID=2093361 RepID=A0A419EN07_9BACT|nr:MAG: prepilin-type N-terminal cleavage/methylation domain-containing protein [Candidatus Abyssubacteria bacterium SURF_17]
MKIAEPIPQFVRRYTMTWRNSVPARPQAPTRQQAIARHFPATSITSCAAFTLIELLVAITILGTIFTIVFGTFAYTLTNAESQQERAAVYHRASFILNTFSQSIASAYVPFGGQYQENEDGEPIFLGEDSFVGEVNADSLSAFTANVQGLGSKEMPGIVHVRYETTSVEDTEEEQVLADVNNPLVLTCVVESLLSVQDENSEPIQWTLNIHSLNLEYFDGSDWIQEWSYEEQGMLPTAVRLELELADADGSVYTFSTTARVHVDTPLEELEEPGAETQEEEEEDAGEEEEGSKETEESGSETPTPLEEEESPEATDETPIVG